MREPSELNRPDGVGYSVAASVFFAMRAFRQIGLECCPPKLPNTLRLRSVAVSGTSSKHNVAAVAARDIVLGCQDFARRMLLRRLADASNRTVGFGHQS